MDGEYICFKSPGDSTILCCRRRRRRIRTVGQGEIFMRFSFVLPPETNKMQSGSLPFFVTW